MTIAVSVKVHDGLVLAADSASTLTAQVRGPEGQTASSVLNVYTHANKIFNLRKGLPIAAMTWGAGSIGDASISTLAKDLRNLLTRDESWYLDPESYTMEEVASLVRRFFFEDRYVPLYKDSDAHLHIGFMVVGYSAGASAPEVWQVQISGGASPKPEIRQAKEAIGIDWSGEIELITRIVNGHGTLLGQALSSLGVEDEKIRPAVGVIQRTLARPLVQPPMPIQDAIDLARFLVDASIKYSRFTPGAPTVGGPLEMAAVTKHEGFRWVERKHYFSSRLNPAVGESVGFGESGVPENSEITEEQP